MFVWVCKYVHVVYLTVGKEVGSIKSAQPPPHCTTAWIGLHYLHPADLFTVKVSFHCCKYYTSTTRLLLLLPLLLLLLPLLRLLQTTHWLDSMLLLSINQWLRMGRLSSRVTWPRWASFADPAGCVACLHLITVWTSTAAAAVFSRSNSCF